MLNDFIEIVERLVTYFTIFDFLDIVIVSFLVYYLIVFIRDTRIQQLMKGILFIFIAYLLASWLKLNTLLYIMFGIADLQQAFVHRIVVGIGIDHRM